MYIRVQVSPGSKKETLRQVSDNRFEIEVKEPAERNLANRRVLDLMAEHFKIPSGKLRIINGHKSPVKLISIREEI